MPLLVCCFTLSLSLWGNSTRSLARSPDRPFLLPFRDVDMNSAVERERERERSECECVFLYLCDGGAAEPPFPTYAFLPSFPARCSLTLSVLPSLNDVITKVAAVGGGRRGALLKRDAEIHLTASSVIARLRREGLLPLPLQPFKVNLLRLLLLLFPKLFLAAVCAENEMVHFWDYWASLLRSFSRFSEDFVRFPANDGRSTADFRIMR